jgi:hypothetical protein
MYIFLMDRLDWTAIFGDLFGESMNFGVAFAIMLLIGCIVLAVIAVVSHLLGGSPQPNRPNDSAAEFQQHRLT